MVACRPLFLPASASPFGRFFRERTAFPCPSPFVWGGRRGVRGASFRSDGGRGTVLRLRGSGQTAWRKLPFQNVKAVLWKSESSPFGKQQQPFWKTTAALLESESSLFEKQQQPFYTLKRLLLHFISVSFAFPNSTFRVPGGWFCKSTVGRWRRARPRIGPRRRPAGHLTTTARKMRTSCKGRSWASVSTFWMAWTTSMPSTTSPNTVYWPSRWGVPPFL